MKLVKGEGSPTEGACWMSAISWYAGQTKWTDDAECVDPIIRQLCIYLNDRLSDRDRERVIGPHLFAPMGTRNPDLFLPRLYRVVEFANEQVAKALDASRLHDFAEKIRGIGKIGSKDDCNRSKRICREARAAAYAAANAAANAAAYAAYAAANAAADDAANAAADDAAYAAANAAAYAAANAAANAAVLNLILELCAIGEKSEVPQVRDLCELPQ